MLSNSTKMEESPSSSCNVLDGIVTGIRFGLATPQEICTSSNSDCPINHASQLSNPFLGLPLDCGRCESCGTGEPGQCEGHFGFIELPIPIYHPSHVEELKRMFSLLCLKCLKMKNRKFQIKNMGIMDKAFSCCEDASQVSVHEGKTSDGARFLVLKVPSKSRLRDGFWNFLDKYGFRYGDNHHRALLPSEVMVMLQKMPGDTRKKLAAKGYFPQGGYILQYLPVPPNCLSVPDVSDGISVMSSDLSITMLKKVLKQVEIIKSSRSGEPNFESHEVEANDLQLAVAQYLQVRGSAKASRDVDNRFGVSKEPNNSSTKAWLEKMKTLFIRKGSGFSSRSVITGDPYKRVNEIGLPFEIAQRITFEERVNQHNINFLQKLVDEKLCLTYKDGSSTYSLREGSKGHTFLRPGQVVHRRIMDGDIVFINRPPTTHKHSLQALSVYVHDDHTVKINPLICGPLSADFDGDCVHLFYPQSLTAKAEVLELFSVEKQLLSSHSGNLNLQMATDSLLSLKMLFQNCLFNREASQQLAMFLSNSLPHPALLKVGNSGPMWTALQIIQTALPATFDCYGERHLIRKSEVLKIDFNRDVLQSIINDVVTSIFFEKGPNEVLRFFDSLQPLLMESLFCEGSSVCLEDFYIPKAIIDDIHRNIQDVSPLLFHLRSTYNEVIDLQLENYLRMVKIPAVDYILKSSTIGDLIDSKSDSAINKVVQQIGFLGLQMSAKGKLYSRNLVEDMVSLFESRYPFCAEYPAEEFGLIRSCLFHGLDPYQKMVHSISSREVMVRSSRGLTEPGTLFKNLMAILRDVVICYDGTVRNVCSNSVIQFEYGVKTAISSQSFLPAGEPVGVLAATAMSNPAYKAVLDSTPSSNSSWEMMKEILLCGVNFKNDLLDRRVILYLKDCSCGRKYCRENAAYLVKNQLKKVSLKDTAVEFLIEYKNQQTGYGSSEIDAGLVGHIHLNKVQLKNLHISLPEVLEKCQEGINSFRKKRKLGHFFKKVILSASECCSFSHSCESKRLDMPCLMFVWQDGYEDTLEKKSHVLADIICPILLDIVVKGDPRVCSANIIWMTSETPTWIRNPYKIERGELVLDVVLEKDAVKQSGDAWRIVLDSCLPVFHLIDTSRSIPYAIKQVQELLGISSSFEQAIQRLSSSVKMVAKGVHKDHLMLLANSMTCAGNLIGFNMGGIKALSRSLNIQVPFTEATLFTPKKCFERAAEKCHVDSLSSIVASCSWGKRVAVGTGTKFDILWHTKEVGVKQEEECDVYSFLHLVRGNMDGEQLNSACLGAELDYLDSENEDMGIALSPEQNNNFDKPTFEDTVDLEGDFGNDKWDSSKPTNSNWEKSQTPIGDSKGSGEWVVEKKTNSKPGGWSSWGTSTAHTEDDVSAKTQQSGTSGWNAMESGEGQSRPGSWSAAAKNVEGGDGPRWNEKDDQQKGFASPTAGAWTGKAADNSTSSGKWDAIESSKGENQSGQWAAWGKKVEEADETGWSKKGNCKESGMGGNQSEPVAAWGKKVEETGRTPWSKNDSHMESGKGGNQSGPWSSWGQKGEDKTAWGEKVEEADQTGWSKKGNHKESGMGGNQSEPVAAWGKKVAETGRTPWSKNESPMESGKGGNQSGTWSSWGKKGEEANKTAWGKKVEEAEETGWSKKGNYEESRMGVNQSEPVAAWGQKVAETGGTPWSKNDRRMESEKGGNQSGSWSSWGKKGEEANKTPWSKTDSHMESVDQSSGFVSSVAGVGGERAQEDSSWSSGKNLLESASRPNQSGSWASWGKKAEQADDKDWTKKDGQVVNEQPSGSRKSENSWGAKDPDDRPNQSKTSGGWGSSNNTSWNNVGSQSEAGQQNESQRDSSQNATNDLSNQTASKSGWDSPKIGGWSGSDSQVQWGHQKHSFAKRDPTDNSRGWGSPASGEWKNKRNRPSRFGGGSNDDTSAGAPFTAAFTATRQRLDMFTSEEQDVLLDVEQVMQSIRRIMQQSSDGDPLSADDQKYILDNVFNYHPDKAAKMGAGIDYVMVNKHSSFQESRCFYVVLTDGHREDFSYRKCLENFIKGKYPEKAESFNGKYFRKPRNPSNRERSVAPEEAGGASTQ